MTRKGKSSSAAGMLIGIVLGLIAAIVAASIFFPNPQP